MFNKNKLAIGALLGIFIPIIAFAILWGIFYGLDEAGILRSTGLSPQFRERTIGIVAIACNAFALNYYNKRRYTDSVRGVVLPSFVYIAGWLYLFGEIVMNNVDI